MNDPTALGFGAFLVFLPCPLIVFNYNYLFISIHSQGVCILRQDISAGI